MAKKIDLRTDPHTLDSNLDLPDFGLDDIEGSLSVDAKDKKKRSPVIDVFKGSVEGAKDKFKDPSFLAQVTRDSLPRNYGKIFSTADSAAETASSLYNDAVKELKPQVARIAKRVDSLVPAESKRLKSLTTKIKDYFGDEAPLPETSKEQVQDQSIQQALGAIFSVQENQNLEREARDNSQKRVSEQLEGNRFEMNYGILSGIKDAVLRSANYTEKIDQAFQKKSLELQYRSYFAQAELLQTSSRYYEMFLKQNDAIARNTALPEFVKIKNSERFKEMARTKFIDSVQDSLFGADSTLNRGFKKIAADAREYLGGIKQGLEAASMGIDAVEAIQEQNKIIEEIGGEKITAAKLAGNALGQWGVDKFTSHVSDKVRDKLETIRPAVDFGAKVSGALTNPAGAIESLRNSERFQEKKNAGGIAGSAYGLLDRGLSYFTDQAPDMRINNPLGTDTSGPEIFNGKTQISITEIIPGYLARILREIYVLRSGDDKASLVSYDHSSGKFLDKALMTRKIRNKLSESVKQTGFDWRLQSAVNDLFSRDRPQGDELGEIKKFFANIAKQGNLEFTPEKIQQTDAFQKLPIELQVKIKTALEGYVSENKDKFVNQYKLTQNLSAVRDTTPDIRRDIERYIRDGHAEILEDEGIIRQEKDGSFRIDEDKYHEFVQQEGIVKSDKTKKTNITPIGEGQGLKKLQERRKVKVAHRRGFVKSDETTKEDIHPLSPRRALNAVKRTKIFDWMYKKGEGPQVPKRGPMAQDVHNTMGDDAAPGGKAIDLTTMNGNNMAAIQALNERQEKLLKDDKSQFYLEGIHSHTAQIIEILSNNTELDKTKTVRLGSAISRTTKGSGRYSEIASDLVNSFTDLFKKATRDLNESAQKVGKFTQDRIIKPGREKISQFYSDNKDPLAHSTRLLLHKAGRFASRALTTAQDVVFNQIPSGARTAMVLGKKLKDQLRETINKTTDVYIKGRKSPVLLAELMKAGYYIDSVTGKVIENMDDLKNMKGDIKNRAGRVVLRIEDAAQGMYDSRGQKIRASFEKIKDFVWNVARTGFGRAKKFWESAAIQGKEIFDKIRDKAKPVTGKLMDKIRGTKLRNPFENMSLPNLGIGFGNDQIYDVLVEIRDLMRGEDPPRHEDKEDFKKNFVGPLPQSKFSKIKESSNQNLSDLKDKVSQKLKTLKDKTPDNVKGLKKLVSEKSQVAKQKTTELISKAKQNDRLQETKTRVQKLRERINDRIAEAKDRNSARKSQVKIHGSNPKYKGGTNAIDRIIGMGSTLKDKFTAIGGMKGLKEKTSSAVSAVKTAKGIKGKALAGISSLFSGFGSSQEESQEPADKLKLPVLKKTVEVQDDEVAPKSTKKRKKSESSSTPAFNDIDGNGRRDGSFRDRLEELEERNQARKKKVAFNEPEAKYKSDKNIIDTIMDKAKGIFGMLTNGIGGIFGMAGSLISGASSLLGIGGAGGIIGKLGGMLKGGVGGVARGAGAVAGTLGRLGGVVKNVASVGGVASRLGGIVSTVRNVALIGSLASGGAISTVASAIGAGLAAVGSVLASPVVLGALAVGAVGFGLYKLYKYANRDNVDEFEDIRMKQYGIGTGEPTKKYNHQLLTLEAYLTDGRVGYGRGQAYLLDKKIDPKDLLDIFSIDQDDQEHAELFSMWFQQRFKPFFLTHMTALFSVDNKAKLSEVNKLPVDQKLKYLNLIGFESGPYSIATSPFKDSVQLNTDRTFALNAIKNLITKLSEGQRQSDKKASPPSVVRLMTPEMSKTFSKKLDEKTAESPKPTVPQEADKKKDSKTSGLDALQQQGEDGDIKESKTLNPSGVSGLASKMTPPLKEAGGPQSDGRNWSQYVNLKSGVSLEGMNPEMLQNLKAMIQEYGEKTGKKITINSGARSTMEQEALYRKDPKTAAPPGRSLHEFGLAFDAQSTDVDELDKMGLMRKYGFTRPVGGETWHVEPAGIQVDINRAKKDSDFAASAVGAGLFKGGGGIGSIEGSDKGKRDFQMAQNVLFGSVVQKVPDRTEKSPEEKTLARLTRDQSPVEKKSSEPIQNTPAPMVARSTSNDKKSTSSTNDVIARNEPQSIVAEKPVTMKTMAANNDSFSKMEKLPDIESMPDSKVSATDNTAPIDISKPAEVKKAVADIAQRQGQDPNMMTTFAAVESSLKPNARGNGTSEGLFGFTKTTWDEQMGKHARKFNIPKSTPATDVRASTILASEYVRENKAKIKQYKSNPTLTDVYFTHFLGPTGSRKFLTADPNAIAAEVLPNAASSNRSYFYENGRALTVAEVYQKVDKKLQKTGRDFGIDLPSSPSLEGRVGKVAEAGGSSANSESIDRSSTLSKSRDVEGSNQSIRETSDGIGPSQPRGSQTPRAPEVVSAPARPRGYNGPGSTVLTPSPMTTQRQLAQDSFARINDLVDVGTQQLDVQKKMLDALMTLVKNSDPEILKSALSQLPQTQTPSQTQPSMPASRSLSQIETAIDLRRKVG